MEEDFMQLLLLAHNVQTNINNNYSLENQNQSNTTNAFSFIQNKFPQGNLNLPNNQKYYEIELSKLEISNTEDIFNCLLKMLLNINSIPDVNHRKIILIYSKNFLTKLSYKDASLMNQNPEKLRSFVQIIEVLCNNTGENPGNVNCDLIIEEFLKKLLNFVCSFCSKEIKSHFICLLKDHVIKRISNEIEYLSKIKQYIMNINNSSYSKRLPYSISNVSVSSQYSQYNNVVNYNLNNINNSNPYSSENYYFNNDNNAKQSINNPRGSNFTFNSIDKDSLREFPKANFENTSLDGNFFTNSNFNNNLKLMNNTGNNINNTSNILNSQNTQNIDQIFINTSNNVTKMSFAGDNIPGKIKEKESSNSNESNNTVINNNLNFSSMNSFNNNNINSNFEFGSGSILNNNDDNNNNDINNNNNNNNNIIGNGTLQSFSFQTNFKTFFSLMKLIFTFEDDIHIDKAITETHFEFISDSFRILCLLKEIALLTFHIANSKEHLAFALPVNLIESKLIYSVYHSLVNCFYNFSILTFDYIQKNINLKIIGLDIIYYSSIVFSYDYLRILIYLLFFDSLPFNKEINYNNANDNKIIFDLFEKANYSLVNINFQMLISDLLEYIKQTPIIDHSFMSNFVGKNNVHYSNQDVSESSYMRNNDDKNSIVIVQGMIIDLLVKLNEKCLNNAFDNIMSFLNNSNKNNLIANNNNSINNQFYFNSNCNTAFSSQEHQTQINEILSVLECYNTLYSNLTLNFLHLLFGFTSTQRMFQNNLVNSNSLEGERIGSVNNINNNNNNNFIETPQIKESTGNTPKELAILNLICKILNYFSSLLRVESIRNYLHEHFEEIFLNILISFIKTTPLEEELFMMEPEQYYFIIKDYSYEQRSLSPKAKSCKFLDLISSNEKVCSYLLEFCITSLSVALKLSNPIKKINLPIKNFFVFVGESPESSKILNKQGFMEIFSLLSPREQELVKALAIKDFSIREILEMSLQILTTISVSIYMNEPCKDYIIDFFEEKNNLLLTIKDDFIKSKLILFYSYNIEEIFLKQKKELMYNENFLETLDFIFSNIVDFNSKENLCVSIIALEELLMILFDEEVNVLPVCRKFVFEKFASLMEFLVNIFALSFESQEARSLINSIAFYKLIRNFFVVVSGKNIKGISYSEFPYKRSSGTSHNSKVAKSNKSINNSNTGKVAKKQLILNDKNNKKDNNNNNYNNSSSSKNANASCLGQNCLSNQDEVSNTGNTGDLELQKLYYSSNIRNDFNSEATNNNTYNNTSNLLGGHYYGDVLLDCNINIFPQINDNNEKISNFNTRRNMDLFNINSLAMMENNNIPQGNRFFQENSPENTASKYFFDQRRSMLCSNVSNSDNIKAFFMNNNNPNLQLLNSNLINSNIQPNCFDMKTNIGSNNFEMDFYIKTHNYYEIAFKFFWSIVSTDINKQRQNKIIKNNSNNLVTENKGNIKGNNTYYNNNNNYSNNVFGLSQDNSNLPVLDALNLILEMDITFIDKGNRKEYYYRIFEEVFLNDIEIILSLSYEENIFKLLKKISMDTEIPLHPDLQFKCFFEAMDPDSKKQSNIPQNNNNNNNNVVEDNKGSLSSSSNIHDDKIFELFHFDFIFTALKRSEILKFNTFQPFVNFILLKFNQMNEQNNIRNNPSNLDFLPKSINLVNGFLETNQNVKIVEILYCFILVYWDSICHKDDNDSFQLIINLFTMINNKFQSLNSNNTRLVNGLINLTQLLFLLLDYSRIIHINDCIQNFDILIIKCLTFHTHKCKGTKQNNFFKQAISSLFYSKYTLKTVNQLYNININNSFEIPSIMNTSGNLSFGNSSSNNNSNFIDLQSSNYNQYEQNSNSKLVFHLIQGNLMDLLKLEKHIIRNTNYQNSSLIILNKRFDDADDNNLLYFKGGEDRKNDFGRKELSSNKNILINPYSVEIKRKNSNYNIQRLLLKLRNTSFSYLNKNQPNKQNTIGKPNKQKHHSKSKEINKEKQTNCLIKGSNNNNRHELMQKGKGEEDFFKFDNILKNDSFYKNEDSDIEYDNVSNNGGFKPKNMNCSYFEKSNENCSSSESEAEELLQEDYSGKSKFNNYNKDFELKFFLEGGNFNNQEKSKKVSGGDEPIAILDYLNIASEEFIDYFISQNEFLEFNNIIDTIKTVIPNYFNYYLKQKLRLLELDEYLNKIRQEGIFYKKIIFVERGDCWINKDNLGVNKMVVSNNNSSINYNYLFASKKIILRKVLLIKRSFKKSSMH